MKDGVDKLVAMMMAQMEQRNNSMTLRDARDWLLEQGFDADDVNEAVRRVIGSVLNGQEITRVRLLGPAPRLYSPLEEVKLSHDIRETLTRLEASEMISGLERELLIERLMQSDSENEMDLLDYMLTTVIGVRRNAETHTTLMNTFEGLGPTYH